MCTVLVADDDVGVRFIVCEFLKAAGLEVVEARNGAAAVEMLKDWTPDLLVTDIFMPDGDGIELVRYVRKNLPFLPVIAMSGGSVLLPEFNSLRSAEMLGATVTLAKPFTRKDFATALYSALGRSDAGWAQNQRLAS
ncbi:MAG: response regulator [Alphaproteobacteria bacterium]|nr:response regulator [Alphaproteobacteria bacterium]MDX5415913.1 response regulator [Alphaproteobacteria bacterium]MDX5493206.1 response regulator [Alphaproteobacteria bacterium]